MSGSLAFSSLLVISRWRETTVDVNQDRLLIGVFLVSFGSVVLLVFGLFFL